MLIENMQTVIPSGWVSFVSLTLNTQEEKHMAASVSVDVWLLLIFSYPVDQKLLPFKLCFEVDFCMVSAVITSSMMTGDGPEVLRWALVHNGVPIPVLPRREGAGVLSALKPSFRPTALFLLLFCTLPLKKNPLAGLLLLQLAVALPHVSVN